MGYQFHPDAVRPTIPDLTLPLQVRVTPAHAASLHDHLARLDEADRHSRLGRPVAPDAVEAYCTRGHCADPIILGGFVDGEMVASAELAILPEDRFGLSSAAAKADLMIAVEPDHRRRGYAHHMVTAMLPHAAMKRIALIRLTYAADNQPMAHLTSAMGAVHARLDDKIRAELCTGWIGDGGMTIPIDRTHRFRPITFR